MKKFKVTKKVITEFFVVEVEAEDETSVILEAMGIPPEGWNKVGGGCVNEYVAKEIKTPASPLHLVKS